MEIGKQINVLGNGNVVAEHVDIYIGTDARQKTLGFSAVVSLIPAFLGIAIGVSLMAAEINPALVGSLVFAFLISIAVLMKGTTQYGTIERRAEGHFQHDSEGLKRKQ